MKKYWIKIFKVIIRRGFKFAYIPLDIYKYIFDFMIYKKKCNKIFPVIAFFPVISDHRKNAGTIDSHYFLQDIYMAQEVIKNKPNKHYDVGSRLDGFLSHLLAFGMTITMIDIRPLDTEIDGINFIQSDATNLENIEDASIESISSLHAIEHFGLGRYGDRIDPDACFNAMKSIQRVLKEGGTLYFSVPISAIDGVIFNAHRVFNPITIINTFNDLELKSFASIHNYSIDIHGGGSGVIKMLEQNVIHIGDYDCGLFIFKK